MYKLMRVYNFMRGRIEKRNVYKPDYLYTFMNFIYMLILSYLIIVWRGHTEMLTQFRVFCCKNAMLLKVNKCISTYGIMSRYLQTNKLDWYKLYWLNTLYRVFPATSIIRMVLTINKLFIWIINLGKIKHLGKRNRAL